MIFINSQKGSEWRRWDLHIHAPKTKLTDSYSGENDEKIIEKYIETLERSPVQVFGVTDYFSCDNYFMLIEKYRAKYPESSKVFFPNIEFRLSEVINKENSNPHIHVIFDNNENICTKEKIEKFLFTLKTLESDESGVEVACSELTTTKDYESASISIKGLKDALKDTFGDAKPYLFAFPANNDGIRSTDNSSPRKVIISDKIDKLGDLFFGNSGNKEYFLQDDRYESEKSEPKPVVTGSDAHSFDDLERLEGNVTGFEPTWIKSDLTFRGLKQICFEPDARIHIGFEPPVELRKAHQATKFLTKICVNQIAGYDESNGKWFKNVEIPLNPELTVIIGNKGSGKSALVDIIGLLGESRQEAYFSFLDDKGGNKKFKQRGYAENFEAELTWQSSTKTSKKLDEGVDITKPEAVRYLPQNYFEQLTNEIEIEEFRSEIEDVVFSHVEETDRMGKSTFSDLQEFKTTQSKQETSTLKTRLRELNIGIVNLEEQADPLYRKKLEGELNAKNDELKSLENTKPPEVLKPGEETDEQKELSEKIAKLIEQREKLGATGKKVVESIAQFKNKLQKLTSLLQSVSSIHLNFDNQKSELKTICKDVGLDIDVIINAEIKTAPIKEMIKDVKAEITKLELNNQCAFSSDFDLSTLISHPDLREGYKYVSSKIEELNKQLGAPQRKYQIYLDKVAKWNVKRVEVLGDKEENNSGTIKYLQAQITYIDQELKQKITEVHSTRKEIAKNIFESKKQIHTFYSELKQSVDLKLESVRTDEFSVEIDASFVPDRNFVQDFLNFIKKNRRGSFHGANNPGKVLSSLINDVDWNNFNSIYDFLEIVIDKIKRYEGDDISIKEQLTDTKEFYDFLFSLGYFSAKYELRLGGKNLNELSPGEKGLLLLVFYLQLDKDNIPLVIDQPEDNLDNDSIFAVLAKCIRVAKENRQVILVTHNPNLAIGADAEQIVYVKLEKAKNYKFSYETGAIENPRINKIIVDILEGSQPAFVKRRLKYEI